MIFRATPKYLQSHPGFRKHLLLYLARAVFWRMNCFLRRSTIIELKTFRARLYLPARKNGEGTTMLYAAREDFEPELVWLPRIAPAKELAIDVGANIGVYTIALAKTCREVYAFEPTKGVFAVLEKNTRLNQLRNVKSFQAAVTDRAGTLKLYHHPSGSGSNSIVSVSDSFEEVPAVALDDVIPSGTPVGFLKIDVQGAEELVLKGAKRIITESHPTILFELDSKSNIGDLLAAYGFLRSLGYEFAIINSSGKLEAILEPLNEKNIIATYRERQPDES